MARFAALLLLVVPLVAATNGPLCTPGTLYTQPRCCRTDALGVADLDCITRESTLE